MTSNNQELAEVAQFPSSSSSKTYTVKQDPAGNLSCDCPAWRFKKPNQERVCKHIQQVAAGNIPAAPAPRVDTPDEDTDPDQVMQELLAETEDHQQNKPTWRGLGAALEEMRRERGE